MLEDIKRAVAILNAGRFKHPVKVRMHPLDIAAAKKKYGGDPDAVLHRLIGVPVEPDCSVTRGRPIAEYED